MRLVKIGKTVINMEHATQIDLDPYDEGVRAKVGIMFTGSASAQTGVYDRIFEGREAAMLMDWCRRNALDVQDWQAERRAGYHAHTEQGEESA